MSSIIMNYHIKYLKYKKYLNLQKMIKQWIRRTNRT